MTKWACRKSCGPPVPPLAGKRDDTTGEERTHRLPTRDLFVEG
jgi:hypothetical protein